MENRYKGGRQKVPDGAGEAQVAKINIAIETSEEVAEASLERHWEVDV